MADETPANKTGCVVSEEYGHPDVVRVSRPAFDANPQRFIEKAGLRCRVVVYDPSSKHTCFELGGVCISRKMSEPTKP